MLCPLLGTKTIINGGYDIALAWSGATQSNDAFRPLSNMGVASATKNIISSDQVLGSVQPLRPSSLYISMLPLRLAPIYMSVRLLESSPYVHCTRLRSVPQSVKLICLASLNVISIKISYTTMIVVFYALNAASALPASNVASEPLDPEASPTTQNRCNANSARSASWLRLEPASSAHDLKYSTPWQT